MSKFTPPPQSEPTAPPSDTFMTKWRSLTEAMIFAALYGTEEYMRLCDRTGKVYNRDAAIRRCVELGKAVLAEPIHPALEDMRLHHCHAANDSPTFRARFAHLLPKRPRQMSQAERRTGVPDAQREREADGLAAAL